MVFGATVPSFAATEVVNSTWTSYFASMRNDLNIINATMEDLFTAFAGQTGIMYNSISEMMSWLTPVGSFNSNKSITGVTLYEVVDYIAWTLTGVGPTVYDIYTSTAANINGIANNILSWMGTNNTNLDKIKHYIGNPYNGDISTPYTYWVDVYENAHRALLWSQSELTGTKMNGSYYLPTVFLGGWNDKGVLYNWRMGTPIGNIALILKQNMMNNAAIYTYRWNADLKHYNDNLTAWEYDTLTQTPFTPESAIQGLYHYFAYVQRDVARLTYVLANQEDIDTRAEIKDSGIEDLKTQLYDRNNGGMQLGDMTDTLGLGASAKSSFNLGSVNKSKAFSFTDDGGWGFWSKACENDMLGVQETRMLKTDIQEPETPLLDDKINAMWEGLGL